MKSRERKKNEQYVVKCEIQSTRGNVNAQMIGPHNTNDLKGKISRVCVNQIQPLWVIDFEICARKPSSPAHVGRNHYRQNNLTTRIAQTWQSVKRHFSKFSSHLFQDDHRGHSPKVKLRCCRLWWQWQEHQIFQKPLCQGCRSACANGNPMFSCPRGSEALGCPAPGKRFQPLHCTQTNQLQRCPRSNWLKDLQCHEKIDDALLHGVLELQAAKKELSLSIRALSESIQCLKDKAQEDHPNERKTQRNRPQSCSSNCPKECWRNSSRIDFKWSKQKTPKTATANAMPSLTGLCDQYEIEDLQDLWSPNMSRKNMDK